ncbi:MAG: hypothetical protein DME06_05630 [Candidatus Rokuibacteriota bacterium]|nr:MAG: hypothetical protein DME06_05630 [Candidatus Rokubacteria bacterium]
MSSAWPERVIEAGTLFLLVFAPLAFGTVEPWSEAIAELVVLAIAATYVLGMLRHWEFRVELPPGWFPALLFLALVFVRTLPRLGAARSLDPHATWREGVKLLTVAGFFVVCYNTYRTAARARRAVWTMVVTGTVISIFGIAERVTWNGRLYWIGPPAPVNSSPFGPYVNRAHFAGLMVIVVPVALAFGLAATRGAHRGRRARRWADRLKEWSTERGATRLIPFLVLVMGGAALVSGSRGGLVALAAGLLVMSGRLWAQGERGRGRAARVLLAAVLIVLTGAWISGDVLYGTVERLADEVGRPTESTRLFLWMDALRLWREAPALGTGLATFAVAYPHVRTFRAPVTFTHAESDWVELLADTGAVGLGLALAATAALGLALRRRLRHADSRWARALTLAGLVALVGTAVQGVANYNLPVLSNFLYLAVVVALSRSGHASPEG